MAFATVIYHSPFRTVSNKNHGCPCGFCGTHLSVKYTYEVENISNFEENSRSGNNTVYACNSCVLKRIWTPRDTNH